MCAAIAGKVKPDSLLPLRVALKVTVPAEATPTFGAATTLVEAQTIRDTVMGSNPIMNFFTLFLLTTLS
jgi:hypothetical protein